MVMGTVFAILFQSQVAASGRSLTCDPSDYDLTVGPGLGTTANIARSGSGTTITPNKSGDTLEVADLLKAPGPTVTINIPKGMTKGILVRDQVKLFNLASISKIEFVNLDIGGLAISGPIQLGSDGGVTQTARLNGEFIDQISCPPGSNSASIYGGSLVFQSGDGGMGTNSQPKGQIIVSNPLSIAVTATNGSLCLNAFPYLSDLNPANLYLSVTGVTISGNADLHLRQNGYKQVTFRNATLGNGSISTGAGADLCY
jgi:hypothetical protein